MNKTKPAIAILFTLLLLNACGTIVEGLSGSKKKESDAFLIKKKSPLVLPPSFGELPEPGIKKDENVILTKEDISNIEKIINQSSSTNIKKNNNNLTSSIEESIIEKINKKKIKEVNLNKVVEKKKEIPKKGFFNKIKQKFNNLEH